MHANYCRIKSKFIKTLLKTINYFIAILQNVEKFLKLKYNLCYNLPVKESTKSKKNDEKGAKEDYNMFFFFNENRAIDIAHYIINYCNNIGRKITNLQLQKILYFCWIDYYKETGKELFYDNFLAYKFGPVIYDVYRENRKFGAEPIIYESNDIEKKIDCDFTILNSAIDKYSKMSAYELVEKSHKENGAWYEIYKDGIGERFVIPYDLIKEKKG